jgi:hypothetical protein
MATGQWYGMLTGNIIGGLIIGHLNPVFFPLFLSISIIITIRIFRSYKIKGVIYNNYLLPVEQAYNSMCKVDRLRYKGFLEEAYKACDKNVPLDRKKLRATLDLFNLTADENKESQKDKSAVEIELEALRVRLEQEKETKRLRDEILAELDNYNGHPTTTTH